MNHIRQSEQPYFERSLKERQCTYDVNDPLSDYHGFPDHQAMLADETEILEQEARDEMEWYGIELTAEKLLVDLVVNKVKAHSA
jgi:hypothetical protein